MDNKFHQTIKDLDKALTSGNIAWLLTRLLSNSIKVDDLDILVKEKDFNKAIQELGNIGYQMFSHDMALGGRKKGYQVNLVKKGRIKIDLHKDFTWRGSKYIDSSAIWKSKKKVEFGDLGVHTPSKDVDTFLIFINILFEKTYITAEDKEILQRQSVLSKKDLVVQARKYHWEKSLKMFTNWLHKREEFKFPQFLPFFLVLYSYMEKFRHERQLDLISLTYYFFFRTRHIFTGKLPY